jgi:hypothetical protein
MYSDILDRIRVSIQDRREKPKNPKLKKFVPKNGSKDEGDHSVQEFHFATKITGDRLPHHCKAKILKVQKYEYCDIFFLKVYFTTNEWQIVITFS